MLTPKVLGVRLFFSWLPLSWGPQFAILFGSGKKTRVLFLQLRFRKPSPHLPRMYAEWHQVDCKSSWELAW